MMKSGCLVVTLLFFVRGSFSEKQNQCGIAPLNTRIFGGADAPDGSWPWVVTVWKNGWHKCAGSLISKHWVLTAVKCVYGNIPEDVTVYLGKRALAVTSPNELLRNVSEIHIHPGFNRATMDNDIVLLRLEPAVVFTDYISPVCLASRDSTFPSGTPSWITGWGMISYTAVPPYPFVLREASVSIYDQTACTSMLGAGVTNNMICAGYLSGGIGPCGWDEGGALVVKQDGVWLQAGIVSWGKGCAEPNSPAVYTSVAQFQDWISSIVHGILPGYITYVPPP